MNLYFLRHGIAEDRQDWLKKDDSLRPLTKEGKKKIHHIAKGMKNLGMAFDRILTSPYDRALRTAEIVVEVLKQKKQLEIHAELSSEGDPKKLLAYIAASEKEWEDVLLVGHEPYLSQLISMMIYGNPGVSIHLKKGGLCRISGENLRYGKCAQMELLLAPKIFEALR